MLLAHSGHHGGVRPHARTGTVNLVAALKAERRFRDFLKIVAAAGMEDQLASAGPFTLVAPSDHALNLHSRNSKQLIADKQRCLRIYKPSSRSRKAIERPTGKTR